MTPIGWIFPPLEKGGGHRGDFGCSFSTGHRVICRRISIRLRIAILGSTNKSRAQTLDDQRQIVSRCPSFSPRNSRLPPPPLRGEVKPVVTCKFFVIGNLLPASPHETAGSIWPSRGIGTGSLRGGIDRVTILHSTFYILQFHCRSASVPLFIYRTISFQLAFIWCRNDSAKSRQMESVPNTPINP
jgi:hypothetical protein